MVRRLAGATLATIEGPHVSIFYPGSGRCSASWRVKRNVLYVQVDSVAQTPPSKCLSAGTHKFRLREGALRED